MADDAVFCALACCVGSGVMRGEGWLALLLVTKEREGLASSFGGGWGGAGLGRSPRLGGRLCYKVKRIGEVRDQDVVVESASKQPHFSFTVGWY